MAVLSHELEQAPKYSQETRHRNDLETMYAECLDGVMRTPFEYTYDPIADTIYASDGGDVDKIFSDAYADICTKSDKNPNLDFIKRRTTIELEECGDMHAMLKGELPNTMVVVSDFPEELMDYPKDYYGYNVTRKQTMLRVITRSGNKLQMITQTLDGSNRQALESLYDHFGQTPEPGELLKQRIHTSLDEHQQHELVNDLRDIYDESLLNQSGVLHAAGRPISKRSEEVDTYKFVQQQEDIISLAVHEKLLGKYTDAIHYQTVAALEARFEKYKNGDFALNIRSTDYNQSRLEQQFVHNDNSIATFVMQAAMIQQERQQAGLVAARQGKTYSACGGTSTSFSSQSESMTTLSAVEQLDASGYTTENKKEGSEDWDYDDFDYCVDCQAPPASGESKKAVGPCKICEECVNTKHGGKQ